MNYTDARNQLLRIKSPYTAEYLGIIVRYRPRLIGSTIELYDLETGVLRAEWLFADCPQVYIEALAEAL